MFRIDSLESPRFALQIAGPSKHSLIRMALVWLHGRVGAAPIHCSDSSLWRELCSAFSVIVLFLLFLFVVKLAS